MFLNLFIFVYILFLFFVSGLGFLFLCNSVLSLLLCLELMVLSIFLSIIIYYCSESLLELMVFMVLAVSESVLGLVLMLIKVMFYGSDFIFLSSLF